MTRLIKTLTKVFVVRCEQSLIRGPQCFNFASGACDSCCKPLCSQHKVQRQEIGCARTVTYNLCELCAVTYDIEKEQNLSRKDSRRLFWIPE